MTDQVKKVVTERAPKAIGPYSQGIKLPAGKPLVFVSGQLPLDPATGQLFTGNIATHTQRVIDNMEAILQEAGSGLDKVIRVDIFLTNIADFHLVNQEYAKRFGGSRPPARQTVQVAELPLEAQIEMSCIAYAEG